MNIKYNKALWLIIILAIVMMVMLSAIASGSSPDGGQMLASIVKIGFFLGVWFIVGIFAIPWFLRSVRKLINAETLLIVSLGLCCGTSIVTESIFENRFKYADELSRMGANIKVEGNSAIIDGVKKLTGARVSAPDLRAGAALVIAGLAADGITVVDDIVYIQRGYENFEDKLRSLGAEIERVSNEKEIQKFRLRVG